MPWNFSSVPESPPKVGASVRSSSASVPRNALLASLTRSTLEGPEPCAMTHLLLRCCPLIDGDFVNRDYFTHLITSNIIFSVMNMYNCTTSVSRAARSGMGYESTVRRQTGRDSSGVGSRDLSEVLRRAAEAGLWPAVARGRLAARAPRRAWLRHRRARARHRRA